MTNRRSVASPARLLLALALFLPAMAAAGSLELCRPFDMAVPLASSLTIPAGSVFRDNGRLDDPLAAFNGDRLQLRLETIAAASIPPLQQCVRVLVRVTSDSSVKAVSSSERRSFTYSGSSQILDVPEISEELLTVKGVVIDQVP